MNEHILMGQIASHIVKGKFQTHLFPKTPEKNVTSRVTELIQISMEKNVPPPLISSDALDKAMHECLKNFETGKFLLPDLIIRADYTGKGREILTKHASASASLTKGKAVLATIIGEDHTHFLTMVKILLTGLGFKTIDMGSCVSAIDVVRTVKREKPDLLGISSPTSSVPEVRAIPTKIEIKKIIADLSKGGHRKNITILIGGYNPEIETASDVGADYYCKNMLQTAERLRKLSILSN